MGGPSDLLCSGLQTRSLLFSKTKHFVESSRACMKAPAFSLLAKGALENSAARLEETRSFRPNNCDDAQPLCCATASVQRSMRGPTNRIRLQRHRALVTAACSCALCAQHVTDLRTKAGSVPRAWPGAAGCQRTATATPPRSEPDFLPPGSPSSAPQRQPRHGSIGFILSVRTRIDWPDSLRVSEDSDPSTAGPGGGRPLGS